jgi:hypothetical protein
MEKINIWILLGFSIFFIIIGIGMDFYYNSYKQTPNNIDDIVNDCKNKDIWETSYCIRDNIETFYKPVITKDGLNMSFEELKENGGDCEYYSKLVVEISEKLGFYSKIHIIDLDEKTAHVYATISMNDSYCIIDQLDVRC